MDEPTFDVPTDGDGDSTLNEHRAMVALLATGHLEGLKRDAVAVGVDWREAAFESFALVLADVSVKHTQETVPALARVVGEVNKLGAIERQTRELAERVEDLETECRNFATVLRGVGAVMGGVEPRAGRAT